MIVEIDTRSPVPPYEQLRAQIADLVEAGQLAHQSRLPPIRQLAADLGLAPGTVARAYRELEQEGIVVTRGRHGTVVVGESTVETRERRVAEAARAFATEAGRLGVSNSTALRAVRDALARVT